MSWWSCYDAEQVEEVIIRALLPHLAPGATAVSHVTNSRSETEGFAAAAAAASVQWVDAPIDGAAQDTAEGRLVVLLGGPPAALDRVEPVLAAYGSPLLRLGDVGQATAFKLVNNALLAANTQLAVAGTRLARDQGIAEDVVLEALVRCTGGSAALRVIQLAGGIANFERLAAPYLHKDVAAFRADGRKLGIIDQVITNGPLDLT